MNKEYDYLIVGSGLFGSVFAHEATKRGKKCLIIDKRNHAGGNVFCKETEGINVHVYGPHIFHTNDKTIWDYVNQFTSFNNYQHNPTAISGGKIYNLPFNMNTFYQMWGVQTPIEAEKIIQEQVAKYGFEKPENLEEQALSLVGKDIYEKLIKGYTEKQWGMKATELPAFIIKRLPVRFTFDNNYFNDRYQGIPIGGYNTIIDGLLKNIEVRLDTDFFDDREHWENIADKVVYTGSIDQYFDYKFGHLEYRSLRFETQVLDQSNYQGNTQINYNDPEFEFTRIIEHKHFEFKTSGPTVITHEYPEKWTPGKEAYYPVNDPKNQQLYSQYSTLANQESTLFGGRLAEFKYYDMHQIIGSALATVKREFEV